MEDKIERFKSRGEDSNQDANKKHNGYQETAKAVELRKTVMDTFLKSRKRKIEQVPTKKGKKGSHSSIHKLETDLQSSIYNKYLQTVSR